MINSKFETKELGEKFIEMGNKFISYAQNNKTVLKFREIGVEVNPECGTVACHGGHACVIFGLDTEACAVYVYGANAIANFLGFVDWNKYKYWAGRNPELWGNEYGPDMFFISGYEAFGFTEEGECTLVDIGKHYISVGNRILKSLEFTCLENT